MTPPEQTQMPLGWTDADIADLRHSIREGEDVTPSDAPAGFWQGQRDLAFRLSERVKSKRELEDLEDKAKIDVLGWLLALPFSLATAGSASDAAELQRRWANVTERANFLGDRAVVLAEAGMREEAKLQITQLDSEFPDDVWVGIKTGDAMRALGDAIETERRYREALADAGSRYDKAGVLERLIPLLEGLGRQMEAHSLERRLEEVLNSSKPSFTYDIHDQTQQQDVDANTHVATREELITTLRTQWYLHKEEIDAILADREFFQPFLRVALHQRAVLGSVPEDPIDPSDAGAVFLLMEMDDKDIIPDVLQCLRMDKQDLERAYGYVLTENFWLPFARLGSELLDELWHFITDTSIDSFARHAVVSGVIAMPHFHPQVRPNIVVFIGEILNTPGLFPLDEVAGILCECADSGLMECKGRAEVFVATMVREPEGPLGVMATREDVLKAFEEGAQEDFISSRAHDVYGVNREWQKAADRSSRDAEDEGAGGEVEWEDHDDQTGRFARTPEHLTSPKVGRNEPCPCGSGKKYKKCHGDPNTAANVRRE